MLGCGAFFNLLSVASTLSPSISFLNKMSFFSATFSSVHFGIGVCTLFSCGHPLPEMVALSSSSTVVYTSYISVLAGSKQLVDQTYFKGSMDFRSRCGLLLEAALRTSVALRSKQLTKTIVEVVAMFKIGCYPNQTEFFDNVMMKTYQCLPRLELKDPIVETPGEAEIATGDVATMEIELTRLHAEAFTRQKVAMFQKQGIPPQVALQTYREGWWFLVHGKALEGPATAEGALKDALELKTDGILQAVDKESLAKFDATRFEDRLLTAWPMVVQNVAQKSGKVKMQFPIPSVPGKYRFTVSVHSQDFLGADRDFSVEVTVVDAKTVKRKPKEAVVEGSVDAPAE
jgi:hypothetical protein